MYKIPLREQRTRSKVRAKCVVKTEDTKDVTRFEKTRDTSRVGGRKIIAGEFRYVTKRWCTRNRYNKVYINSTI